MTEIKKYHLHRGKPDKLQFEIYSLEDYIKSNICATQKPHTHSFYQIIWFMTDGGKHYVDFKEYDVKRNTIFFISKGQVHHFDNQPHEGCIIHFNESFLFEIENYTNIFLRHNIFHSFEKEPLFMIRETDTEELLNIVRQMQNEMWTPNQFAHAEYLKVLLHLFLIAIQRFGVRNNCNGLLINNPSHILFVRFRQLLEENYARVHTVNEYAELLNVSGKTLTKCTKEISHQTPLELINDRLTLEARRLLSYSDKNINEIGYELGFEDSSYFVKFFKRHIKMSPSDFRKSITSQ